MSAEENRNDERFSAWRERVDAYVAQTLATSALAIEAEVGPLPYELGWAEGDSPAEFVAGAVLPLSTRTEIR